MFPAIVREDRRALEDCLQKLQKLEALEEVATRLPQESLRARLRSPIGTEPVREARHVDVHRTFSMFSSELIIAIGSGTQKIWVPGH